MIDYSGVRSRLKGHVDEAFRQLAEAVQEAQLLSEARVLPDEQAILLGHAVAAVYKLSKANRPQIQARDAAGSASAGPA